MSVLAVLAEIEMSVISTEALTAGDPRVSIKTDTNHYDSNYQRLGIKGDSNSGSPMCYIPLTEAVRADSGVFWLHFMKNDNTGFADTDFFYLSETPTVSPANSAFRVYIDMGSSSSGTHVTSYDDAGSGVGGSVGYISRALAFLPWDIKIDVDAGQVTIYRNNVEINSYSLDCYRKTDATRTFGYLVMQANTASGSDKSSTEIVFTKNVDTRGMRVATLVPNAVGTYSDFTGAYTDIDETALSDADKNTIIGPGVQTYSYSDVGTGPQDGKDIAAIVVSTVGHAGIGAPAPTLTNQANINGTLYDIGTGANVEGNGYQEPVMNYVATNPATGQPWTFAELHAAEFGFKSS